MQRELRDRAAQHRVGVAAADHQRADQRGASGHFALGVFHRDALALDQRVVLLPVLAEARIRIRIDDLEILVGTNAQAEFLDAGDEHFRAADQDRLGHALVHDDLHRAQHAFVLALAEHHPCRILFCRAEYRLHDQPGVIDELGKLVAVGHKIVDRPGCHAAFHGSQRHGRCNFLDQARIERFRDQVFRAEGQFLFAVGNRDDVGLFRLCQFGDRAHRRKFHLLRNGGRTDVQRAAKNEREAKHVVDLVRVIGATGRDDRIGPHRLRFVGQDFGLGIGQREYQRLRAHLLEHFRLEHPRGGKPEKNVSAGQDLGERARFRVLRVAHLVVVHLLLAAAVYHPLDVGHPDVFHRQAKSHQQVEAG